MQQQRTTTEGTVGRQRVEPVVETLANLQNQGDSLAAVAHDARNMVTALGLYCDLLEAPGVLSPPFTHYGSELRRVAAASRRLVEKLVTLDHSSPTQPGFWRAEATAAERWPAHLPGDPAQPGSHAGAGSPAEANRGGRAGQTPWQAPWQVSQWDALPSEPVGNLAAELEANRNLLAALAGPAIAVRVQIEGGQKPARITAEDLTRVLVNLVKNAVEAMPSGGRIDIGLRENAGQGLRPWLLLTIEDNGPGMAASDLENIFAAGFSANKQDTARAGGWPACHRGLGLAITRSIVDAAGGRIHAANRALGGARLEIELPVAHTQDGAAENRATKNPATNPAGNRARNPDRNPGAGE